MRAYPIYIQLGTLITLDTIDILKLDCLK